MCWRSQCQTATHHRPGFWSGSGAPVSLFPSPQQGARGSRPLKKGERGAERRINNLRQRRQACAKLAAFGVDIPTQSSLRRLRRLICVDAAPLGAPLRRFFTSGPCFRARKAGCSPADPAAPAALLRTNVQPLKAAPRSWSGRRPRPPEMACEAHPQAPRQPASGFTRFRLT
jgi:hypothetical protein